MATSSIDIVERMKVWSRDDHYELPSLLLADCAESAAEIERLRAALRKIRTGDWGPDECLEDLMREVLDE